MDIMSSKPSSKGAYLKTLYIERRFKSSSQALDAKEGKAFTAQFDPQPFHLADDLARHSLFGSLAASGWHTAAITMRLLVTGEQQLVEGSIGRKVDLGWPISTRPGSVLHVESEVIAKIPSRASPDRRYLSLRSETINQQCNIIQRLQAKLVVLRRPFRPNQDGTVVQEERYMACVHQQEHDKQDWRGGVRIIKHCTLATLALGLAGCATVGEDYQRPVLTSPPAFHNQVALEAPQLSQPVPPLSAWWTGFDDPVLTRIIQRVLRQNLDLAAALARVDQARALAQQAKSQQFPAGSLSTDASWQHQSLQSPLGKLASTFPGYQRNSMMYDFGAGASWEIDLFGGLRHSSEAANAEAQAAEADRLGTCVTVAAEAADAYFQVRGAQKRIALAENQGNADSKLLKLVRLRLRNGLASRRELAQAEAQVAQTRATIPPLRTELETQLNRLDLLMGTSPGTYTAELSQTNDHYVVPAISTALAPADVLRRRPDVLAAERRLAAAEARVGVATSEYYPKVSLSALLGFTSLGSSGLLSTAAAQALVGAGLRWRLFDFGRVDAEIAHTKGARAEALAHYRMAMLRATEDVENAIMTLSQLETQDKDLKHQVTALVQAKQAAEEAYKGGAISLFEVLEQDRLLLAAREQLARVHADDARAAVATFRALGGGW